MVLGVLSTAETTHGYMIFRRIHDWQSETWTDIKPGSIYHALTYLDKKGLVDNKGIKTESKGPAATSYKINERGLEELQTLIREALISYDQETFTAGLAWMHLLPRSEVLALARQRLQQFEATCQFMRALPREDKPQSPDKHPEIIESWTAIFDATVEWSRTFIAHIEAGKYTFEGET